MTPREQTTNAQQCVYSTPLSSGSDQRSRNDGIPPGSSPALNIYFSHGCHTLQKPSSHIPYTCKLSGYRKSRALACRTPVTAHYPEVPRLPWVTVSDKSSAADIPRQWPATGLANTVCMGAS